MPWAIYYRPAGPALKFDYYILNTYIAEQDGPSQRLYFGGTPQPVVPESIRRFAEEVAQGFSGG